MNAHTGSLQEAPNTPRLLPAYQLQDQNGTGRRLFQLLHSTGMVIANGRFGSMPSPTRMPSNILTGTRTQCICNKLQQRFAWATTGTANSPPRMLHQTMIDLVVARPGTIAKYMRNLTVMDLLVEPSDHKLVIFDIRLHSQLQSAREVANVVCTTTSPHADLDRISDTQSPKKFNYKALRNPSTARCFPTSLTVT